MQHREANGSVLGFLVRLTSASTLARCPADRATEALRTHLLPRASILVRLLLSGIAGTLPLGRVSSVGAALLGVVAAGGPGLGLTAAAAGAQATPGLEWLTAALQAVPEVAATSGDKQAFLGAAAAALATQAAGGAGGGGGGNGGDNMDNGDGTGALTCAAGGTVLATVLGGGACWATSSP